MQSRVREAEVSAHHPMIFERLRRRIPSSIGTLPPRLGLTRVLRLAGCLGLGFSLIAWCLCASASAGQSVMLRATLTPEQLGGTTTLGFGFEIKGSAGGVPSPLKQLDVRYPAHLGIVSSGLGLATCTDVVLEALGPMGCPPNSFMGHGSAVAEVPFGAEVVEETAVVAVVRAPEQSGHTAILFYAEGVDPVVAGVVFSGLLFPARPPFGGNIRIAVPLVPSLPEGPDVAVVRAQATIGPSHLTYYEDAHGKRIAYTPKGIVMPARCPRGGFPFAATFGFLDGSQTAAETRVRCPHRRHDHSRRSRRR